MEPHSSRYAFQDAGAAYLASPSRLHKLLGDEPGLGKSSQAIEALDQLQAKRVLVLCQAIGKFVWRDEFHLWAAQPRSLQIIARGVDRPDADIVICTYDLISRDNPGLLKALAKIRWDVLILDEGDALKSPDAKRTRVVLGENCDLRACLAERAKHVWSLTGTPAPNHAGELWTTLRALAPDVILDPRTKTPLTLAQFQERFTVFDEGPYGRRVLGSRNMPALNAKLKQFMLRRRKKDVLPDLPPLRFALHPMSALDLPEPPIELLRELHREDEALRRTYGRALDTESVLSLIQADPSFSRQRRILGQLKAKLAVQIAAVELAGNSRKLIIFAHHRQVIEQIVSGLAGVNLSCAYVHGGCDNTWREIAVHNFQKGQKRVFVGQALAAGHTITLTAASDVLIAEASPVPRVNVQAASRAHRIGQRYGVLARYLTIADTLDEVIMRILLRKTNELAVLLDDDPENLGKPSAAVQPPLATEPSP